MRTPPSALMMLALSAKRKNGRKKSKRRNTKDSSGFFESDKLVISFKINYNIFLVKTIKKAFCVSLHVKS
ncbi:MAG TPA: hypothetical protein CFH79_02510 [Sulfurospirillum sp. UBA11407]|nr:MAG TPA: hypothetical protein CFH79_02510 [Sulfurospirillum sp. UBA11407]